MNLLGMLLKVMTAKSAVKQIAGKTGLSEKQVKRLMTIAIPILLKYLTKNASSGDGVSSLLGALSQHTNKKEVDLQFKEADEKDGGKIIGHILGKKEPEVTQTLSAQSGLTAEQVNQILAIMAPALMSGVSEAASGSAAAQQPSSQHAIPGIFSALLGTAPQTQAATKEEKDDAINGTALLQALLNARK
ncbi:MAG: DUF937 domain-containing protein [Lachnospiraceae bacterium]|nr:DUF937 domain-containing protein [Lachnospiraceae bacterium]